MWDVLVDHFRRHPAQERVVRLMIKHGFSIRTDGGAPRVHAGDVELADVAVARAAGVDRRIVGTAMETIADDDRLRRIFTHLLPALDLREVAPLLDCGVLQVIPEDPHAPGILAGVSRIIAEAGLSVRQAIGEDPDFLDEAKLWVVTAGPIPGSLVPALRAVPGVKGVAVF